MKLNNSIKTAMFSIALVSSAQAVTVFTDTFGYATLNDFTGEGGWTLVDPGGVSGSNVGTTAGGNMWGNPTAGGNTTAAVEYNHVAALAEGDTITMDGNVSRTGGYGYTMTIILWDGSDAGTKATAAGGVMELSPAAALTQVSYVASAADAGKQVIFRYEHAQNWGETEDVTFDVTPIPEPSSTALLGLGGLALIMRRRK